MLLQLQIAIFHTDTYFAFRNAIFYIDHVICIVHHFGINNTVVVTYWHIFHLLIQIIITVHSISCILPTKKQTWLNVSFWFCMQDTVYRELYANVLSLPLKARKLKKKMNEIYCFISSLFKLKCVLEIVRWGKNIQNILYTVYIVCCFQ